MRGRLCEGCRTAHRTALRKRNRAAGLCGCGLPPRAGVTRLGRLWTKCGSCSARMQIRELRRMLRLASAAQAAAPAKALARTVPKHLKYLGPEAALLTWEYEVERDRARDEERLRDLHRLEERRYSARSAENEGPVTVCTRCHQGLAPPGRRRCDSCRARHTFYMRVWRSAPWRQEERNALAALRRAADVEAYRERRREKRLAARLDRMVEVEKADLERRIRRADEVALLVRTIEEVRQ